MTTLYLDTETTGLSPRDGAEIVEVAIIDDAGKAIVDSLVRPKRPIPADATRIHGIGDAMVSKAPLLEELWPEIERAVTGQQVVIYNAAFDRAFFPKRLGQAAQISCAMLAFAKAYGEWNPMRGEYKWQTLATAAAHVGHRFEGSAHRARADAVACRAVWRWLREAGRVE